MAFDSQKDLAVCGLACVLCDVADCPGCKSHGCACESDCAVFKCASKKQVDGCYQCADFPCGEDRLNNPRIRAFNQYARDFGKQALLDRLQAHDESGIAYHRPGGLRGDYDTFETETEILHFLRYGRDDPYAKCPAFETPHFQLRQVCEADAADLLESFYGDVSGWMFYGNDMCKSIFAGQYATLDEMKHCIRVWRQEYANRYYIRFSVIAKQTQRAVGTIEIFDHINSEKNWQLEAIRNGLVLHIDLGAPYETQAHIAELLVLADAEVYKRFGMKHILIRAVPQATERIAALLARGYASFDWERGREHYYAKATM